MCNPKLAVLYNLFKKKNYLLEFMPPSKLHHLMDENKKTLQISAHFYEDRNISDIRTHAFQVIMKQYGKKHMEYIAKLNLPKLRCINNLITLYLFCILHCIF